MVFIFSPEGKKFRSRNELRSHFVQIGSTMNSEDFDFSVKGKGHHNKGKSPSKKNEAENSKENQVTKKATTPVISKRTPKANITPVERPKRELRKRMRSEPEEEPVPEQEDEDDVPEEMEDKDEISNVKLKVKVGYTATGAMIRPSTNGNRKKKRRFRNMHVKKNKPETTPVAKPSVSTTKRVSPVATVTTSTENIKEEKKDTMTTRTTRTTKRKRKGKATEPVAGPSGLQKVKRSPRRILKRKLGTSATGAGGDSEEDDDEDLDYVCSLYPNQETAEPSAHNESGGPEFCEVAADPLQISEEDVRAANGEMNGSKEFDSSHQPFCVPSVSSNGVVDPLMFIPTAETDSVGSMVTVDQTVIADDAEMGDDHMQVVVIGDSVDVHNYAKPHSL